MHHDIDRDAIAVSEYLQFSAEETVGPRLSIENMRRIRLDKADCG